MKILAEQRLVPADQRQLLAFWDRLRGARDCPDEADVAASERRFSADYLFHAERDFTGRLRVRSVGPRIAAGFGGAAPGDLLDIATPTSRSAFYALASTVLDDPAIGCARLVGHSVHWEINLLPLRGSCGSVASVVGSLCPLGPLPCAPIDLYLIDDSVETASVGRRSATAQSDDASIATEPPAKKRQFRVIDGGVPQGTALVNRSRPRPDLRIVRSP